MEDARERARIPGDLLLHPIAIAAMATVIVNDRVLKPRVPSELTGKLSDVAGLVFFPLFVVAIIEAGRRVGGGERWTLTPRAVVAASISIGVVFVLIKTWSPASESYRQLMGVVMWPFDAAATLAQGDGVPGIERVALVEDRTDLLALPALFVPWWIASRTVREGGDVEASTESDDG